MLKKVQKRIIFLLVKIFIAEPSHTKISVRSGIGKSSVRKLRRFGKQISSPRASSFCWKKSQVPKENGPRNKVTGEFIDDVRYSSWTCALIIVFSFKRLQYSARMTVKDFPNELLKIKGREPLPQNYPNHINNMTRANPSFKSKVAQRIFFGREFCFPCCLSFRGFSASILTVARKVFHALLKT